jgi:hypothetical protein
MNSRSLFSSAMEVIVVGSDSMKTALTQVTGCELCSAFAGRTFESVLEHQSNRQGLVTYVLSESPVCPRCDAPIREATLVEGLCDWREPSPAPEIVLVDEDDIAQAQESILGCEHCGEGAKISFDYLLDVVMESDHSETEYLMCRRARCPGCSHEVNEKTLIIPK